MKFYIETYGCQMNASDSELVTRILIDAGHKQATDIADADLILFNTCSVRDHAEQRVLGRISTEQPRRTTNPNLKIGVLGCMAQRMGGTLLEPKLGIDLVVGVDQYQNLPKLLDSIEEEHCITDLEPTQIYHDIFPIQSDNTCGTVTIMRGCNNFCSYCIVPYVRGRERSRPWKEVYREVEQAVEKGLKDITLLGQNVNSYHDGEMDFPDLLKQLDGLPGLLRLRFITSHPKDMSDKLIDTMASGRTICEHIHLALQSGSNKVLQQMNRKYTIEHYMNRISELRKAIPEVGITTDLIAGFPGETDNDFAETLGAMSHIRFDYAFCFKYSNRQGTAAADLPNQIPEAVRLSRLQAMINLQRKISEEKYRAMIGKEVEVYVEDFSKKSVNQVSGKTRDFKIAVLDGDESMIGTLAKAKVLSSTAGTLICY